MPTTIQSRTPVSTAYRPMDIMPIVLVVLLSLLFAGAIWSALSPRPLPTDLQTAAIQGGL